MENGVKWQNILTKLPSTYKHAFYSACVINNAKKCVCNGMCFDYACFTLTLILWSVLHEKFIYFLSSLKSVYVHSVQPSINEHMISMANT